MALFIDGDVSSIEDLNAQDTQLLDVASVEGIDVTKKLELAQAEVSLELEILLKRVISEGQLVWQSAAVGVGNIVTTPALKLWHSFRTLEMVYADAYYSQLNDRFKGKRDQYRDKGKWARERLIESGIGMVRNPVPRALMPELVATPGGGLPAGSYYVTMAWVNGTGEEGACSQLTCVTTETMSWLVIHPENAPNTAVGWNVHIGIAPETMTMQNVAPIGLGQTWQQGGLLTAGRAPGSGQAPNYVQPVPQVMQRG
jgi:hypothetical protein